MNGLRANSDKLLLAAFLSILLFLGFQRLDYAGDGMRHLEHILQTNYPALGEPRWILFPLLLFVVVKPFAVAGLVHSAAQAARVFCLFNVACGFAYLMCLQRWLSDLPASRRAAVLLLAGGSYVFLILATDTIEPTPAVLIAIAGLTFSRWHAGLSDTARITISAGSLALASLVYQGLLFGFFFLPAIFPISLLARRRNILRVAGLALTVPVFTTAILWFSGETPRNAARRFAQGEANSASSRQYSRLSTKNVAGVLIVGPTYAFASIPELRGLTGSLRMLRQRGTIFEGIRDLAAWSCMALAIMGSLVLLVSKRQFALLFAFAGMMALPALRMSQYSYVKYYVLLPFLVVLVVPQLGVSFFYPAALGTLLLLSNVSQLHAERAQSEILRSQVARELYSRIPPRTCFLTSGWGPPVPDWRGDSLAWLDILNGGDSEEQEKIAKANSRLLRERMRKLFCGCPAVVTDSFTLSNLPSLQEQLSYFRITDIPLAELMVPTAGSTELLRTSKFAVYGFSPSDQQHACQAFE